MKALMSIMFWIVGMILTIAHFFAVAFVTIIFYPFDKKRTAAHAQSYWWSDALIGMNPYWKVSVSGIENIDRKKTYVIVVNHQSIADILLVYKLRMQFRWVAKESLFSLPFLGLSMGMMKTIKLKRGEFGSIRRTWREAAGWLRQDMSVIFFPEGTRSDSEEMRGFQNGAFKLALKEKKSILPIVIKGTRDAIPKGSWIFNTKVNGTLEVLPEIDASLFGPKDFEELKNKVRKEFEKALA